jgi:CRISPR type III-B/RAMP module-associated protein Cmr5
MPIIKTDRERANKALEINKGLIESNDPNDKDMATLYKKLPALIISSGLAQALAFAFSKNKSIVKRLIGDETISENNILKNRDVLVQWTTEVLAQLQWINRFNEASPELKEKRED